MWPSAPASCTTSHITIRSRSCLTGASYPRGWVARWRGRQQTGQKLGLLFVDVDNFKSINDTLGHNYGDRVLQGIAERLREAAKGARCWPAWVGMSSPFSWKMSVSVDEVEACAARDRRDPPTAVDH